MRIKFSCTGFRPIISEIASDLELKSAISDAALIFMRRREHTRSQRLTVHRRDVDADRSAYFQRAWICQDGGLDLDGYGSQIRVDWEVLETR